MFANVFYVVHCNIFLFKFECGLCVCMSVCMCIRVTCTYVIVVDGVFFRIFCAVLTVTDVIMTDTCDYVAMQFMSIITYAQLPLFSYPFLSCSSVIIVLSLVVISSGSLA